MKILPSNEYWGRRSGKYVEAPAKGSSVPFGFCFQQKQFASGASRSSRPSKIQLKNVNKGWFR